MTKMNRNIDESRMNRSKEKTMEYVLNTISKETPTVNSWFKPRILMMSPLVLIIALVIMLTLPNNNPPGTNPITISAYESEKIAEISYITTSFIGASVSVNNSLLLSLAVGETTEFEDNDELVNLYFDTLRVFLEDDVFSDSLTVTYVEDDPNSVIILFTVEETSYELHVTFDGSDFSGTLVIAGVIYDVFGNLEDTEEKMNLSFEAKNGQDIVSIEYESEQKSDEIETKYQVHQRIGNVESNKEIKVSQEGNENSVEIKEGNNEYKLAKEMEDGQCQYKLEYKINSVEGEAVIKEQTDVNGNTTYNYQVKEGDTEKEYNQNKPNYDYDDDDDEDEDEDDESSGNGNQKGNQDNETTNDKEKYYVFTV
jgi:hypothetical protein